METDNENEKLKEEVKLLKQENQRLGATIMNKENEQ